MGVSRRIPLRYKALSLAMIVALLVCPGQGAAEETIMGRLTRIRETVNRDRQALHLLERRHAGLQRLVEQYGREIVELTAQRQEAREGVLQNTQLQRAVREEREATARQLDEVEAKGRRRARALFFIEKMRSGAEARLIPSGSAGAKGRHFFRLLAEHDRAIAHSLRELRTRLLTQEEELDGLEKGGREFSQRLLMKEQEIRHKQEKQEEILAEVAKKKIRIGATLRSLGMESARLEGVISSMTGGAAGTSPKFSRRKSASARGTGYFRGEYKGAGLPARFKRPLDGKIAASFGSYTVEGVGAAVRRKGVEFRTTPRSTVKNVAPGVVRFIGALPGYGKVIIVDHGQRDFTLFGRVGALIVHLGQEVEVGESLARVNASEDKETSRLYFEVRKRGSSVDPQRFLR